MWDDLPVDVWARVLQHLPYKERLSACVLVSQKLARAAAAATTSLDLFYFRKVVACWPGNIRTSLTSLRLEGTQFDPSIRQLPCPSLVELELWNCSVQLLPSSSELGLLHSCPALTRLHMQRPTLLDGSSAGPGEQAATARLQHLGLISYDLPPGVAATVAAGMEARLLPYLSHIASLELHLSTGSDRPSSLLLPTISTMVRLQELSLRIEGGVPAATLPDILPLTALKNFGLKSCTLEPSCLLPVTAGLTGLHLQEVKLQQAGELGMSQLLQLLAQLTALQQLTLNDLAGDRPPQELSAHSALTASSNLQELRVVRCGIQAAAWAHVFPAGRKLPNLHTFACCSELPAGRVVATSDQLQHLRENYQNSSAIDSLVSCCPALQGLHISIQADAVFAPLQLLTALTSLAIGPVKPAAIRSDLAALTQLQRLHFVLSPPAPGEVWPSRRQQLAPVTALKALAGLTWLKVASCAGLPQVVRNTADEGSPPDVWRQLLEWCAK